jgi:uncharacterized protein with PQ loop repeat
MQLQESFMKEKQNKKIKQTPEKKLRNAFITIGFGALIILIDAFAIYLFNTQLPKTLLPLIMWGIIVIIAGIVMTLISLIKYSKN